MKAGVSVSMVLYKTPIEKVRSLLEDLDNQEPIEKIVIVDNSPYDCYSLLRTRDKVEWIRPGTNLGFGKAHNLAFRRCRNVSIYHLVVNPDVRIPSGAIEKLMEYMDQQMDVGLIQPLILYPDGEVQHVCKLLPHPIDLFARRFIPVPRIQALWNRHLELRDVFGYDSLAEIPWLSGSFLFLRTSLARQIGLFDERFFLYMEDVDLSRRMAKVGRNVFFPKISITHEYQKESYTSIRGLLMHLQSAIRYFNKWGWIFDHERKEVNKHVRQTLLIANKEGGPAE